MVVVAKAIQDSKGLHDLKEDVSLQFFYPA